MLSHDYSRITHDNCVYYKRLHDGSFIYLILYVDDILIVSKNICEIQILKRQLSREFEMKDLAATKKILGMEIRRDKQVGKFYLSQK